MPRRPPPGVRRRRQLRGPEALPEAPPRHCRARLHPPHPRAGQGLRPGDGRARTSSSAARPARARPPPSACRCWRRSPPASKRRARADPLPHPRAGAAGGRRARPTSPSTRDVKVTAIYGGASMKQQEDALERARRSSSAPPAACSTTSAART